MLENKTSNQLSPLKSPWVDKLLNNRQNLRNLIQNYGSPINVYHPATFSNNYKAFKALLEKLKIDFKIIFPHNAPSYNKLLSLCSITNIGAFSYSVTLLKNCLDKEMDPDQIFMSASGKCSKTLSDAVLNNFRIIINNYEEANKLQAACLNLQKQAVIGIQITGFDFMGEGIGSSTGFSIKESLERLPQLLRSSWHKLRFAGFHFQVDVFCVQRKAEALRQTLVVARCFSQYGIPVKYIDIGSAIPINYVESKEQYNQYFRSLKSNAFDKLKTACHSKESSYQHRPLQEGSIGRDKKAFPRHHKYEKEYFLENVLMQPFSKNELLFQALRSRGIALQIQPAQALLNQTCISLIKIKSVEFCPLNGYMVKLDLSKNQLQFLDSDYLLDPFLISQNPSIEYKSKPIHVYLLDSVDPNPNLVLKRKVTLPVEPQKNDMICLINTGGYEMLQTNLPFKKSEKAHNIFINEINKSGNFELIAS